MLPDEVVANKLLAKFVFIINNVDRFYQYYNGLRNDIYVEQIFTEGNNSDFWKLLNETKYFKRIGLRGNIATRLRIGLSKNIETPFPPFVLDSYINIRGSGNRIARGAGEVVLNAEYRHTVLDKNWGGLQAVVFTDVGSWQPEGENLNSFFNNNNHQLFYGAGGRIYFQKLYNSFLRVDYGFNAIDANQNGVVLGVGQYF